MYFPRYPPAGGRKLYNNIMWFVYALYNPEADKIYIGETSRLAERLEEHNKKNKYNFTTRTAGQWLLIYKEEVHDRKQALIREKQLKSFRGREFIRKQIKKVEN